MLKKKFQKAIVLGALVVEMHTGEQVPIPPKLQKMKEREHKRLTKEAAAQRASAQNEPKLKPSEQIAAVQKRLKDHFAFILFSGR